VRVIATFAYRGWVSSTVSSRIEQVINKRPYLHNFNDKHNRLHSVTNNNDN